MAATAAAAPSPPSGPGEASVTLAAWREEARVFILRLLDLLDLARATVVAPPDAAEASAQLSTSANAFAEAVRAPAASFAASGSACEAAREAIASIAEQVAAAAESMSAYLDSGVPEVAGEAFVALSAAQVADDEAGRQIALCGAS